MISYYIIEANVNITTTITTILDEYDALLHLGISNKYDEGLVKILKLNPDIVFISLESNPKMTQDVFSFCEEIQKFSLKRVRFIGLASNEAKAYKALKNSFFDYLITPLSELELRKSTHKLLKEYEGFNKEKTICLKSYKEYTIVALDKILFLEADNNSTDFILSNGKKICVFKTLKTFESILPESFIRIHHSYIVNSEYISKINFGKLKCSLNSDEIQLPFSKSYRHNLKCLERALEHISMSYSS